jgi:hypothetical protein
MPIEGDGEPARAGSSLLFNGGEFHDQGNHRDDDIVGHRRDGHG